MEQPRKVRRMGKLSPDEAETESSPEQDPEVLRLQRQNCALKKQLAQVEELLAAERAEADRLRKKVTEQQTRLDFVWKTVQELARSVAAFGGALLLHAPEDVTVLE